MALLGTTVFQIQSTATASNANSGGFNPANPNMLTNGAATSATGNSPVFTSASYNFVSGDVGNWLYIQTGTNWTPGWYQIASVAANAATLSAAIGNGIQVNNNLYGTQTVAGVATVASPTGATWTIDYSQADAAIAASTDLVLATTTTLTSASLPFGPQMVGNLIHITGGTGFTVGWYEILSVSVVTATIDRVGGTLASTGGIGNVGGALSLGSSDDAVFELAVSSATTATRYFIKGGSSITYTIGGTVTVAAGGNVLQPIIIESMVTKRGDRPTGSTRPTFACGAAAFTLSGANYNLYGIQITGTAANLFAINGTNSIAVNCKVYNSSTSTNRNALSSNGAFNRFINCEGISLRGYAINIPAVGIQFIINCYAHDSSVGIFNNSAGTLPIVIGTIISNNYTGGYLNQVNADVSGVYIDGNTFYGAENKLGLALSFLSGSAPIHFTNNIIYGFTTGFTSGSTQTAGYDNYNNYFNNTADVSSTSAWQKGSNDIAVNPSFTNVVQRTGATATTTSGNHLVQSGATFQTWGITPGVDFVYIKSGTGVTVGVYGILSVDSETQITTDVTLSANATADKVWQITQGCNFAVGTALKATGYPGVFPGGLTTGYLDIGAAQRQESTGGSGGSFTFS